MASTFAQSLHDAKVLARAMRANLTALSKIGITEATVDDLDGMVAAVEAKDADQERLKAKLIATTAELEALTAQMRHAAQKAVKQVKLEVPTEQWKEYGIQVKQ